MHKLKFNLLVLWHAISRPFRKTYIADMCGHRTKRKGKFVSFGDRAITTLPLSESGNPEYCLDCTGKMSIRCAWCAHPIHIGDRIVLVAPDDAFEIPAHAARCGDGDECVIGCINCPGAMIGPHGCWLAPGRVERVKSPVETLLSEGCPGTVIFIEDFSGAAKIF